MCNKISAHIIADSKSPSGARLTTFIVTAPRIILAELNTHRAFSRNSASSRAIPFKKMVKMVEDDPFIPVAWIRDHPGMQGTKYITDFEEITDLTTEWLMARNAAVHYANELNARGLTKQLCNRLLEPFLYHTALVTATDFENFFALRAHPAAEIHIQDLAEKMLVAYNESIPKVLRVGEWHMPFGDTIEEYRGEEDMDGLYGVIKYNEPASRYSMPEDYNERVPEYKLKICTARCARISYANFEGKDDYFADVKLHDHLSTNGHLSPFEHCAEAQEDNLYHGNFRGFKQYRKSFPDENKSNSRVIKK